MPIQFLLMFIVMLFQIRIPIRLVQLKMVDVHKIVPQFRIVVMCAIVIKVIISQLKIEKIV